MNPKSYNELKKEKDLLGEKLTYSEKLEAREWKEKRESIILRDGNKCTKCAGIQSEYFNGVWLRDPNPTEKELQRKAYIEYVFSKRKFLTKNRVIPIPYKMIKLDTPIILHVHHKYYIKDNLPWEYENSALVTLCNICHQDLHDTEIVPVYTDNLKTKKCNVIPCQKCKGTGFISKYHYYQKGVCFDCDGNRYLEI